MRRIQGAFAAALNENICHMKIFVTGGTGFLGSYLVDQLVMRGHEVVVATRNSSKALENLPYKIALWPPKNALETRALQDCEAVINLAGESIAGARWSDAQKLSIRRSRIELTRELVGVFASSTKLRIFLSASAIGYYGHRRSEVLTEESPAGEGFLADVCREWEHSLDDLKNPAVRKVFLRTGVVLHRSGGFLKELEPLYRNWVGGPVGAGEQFISWVHLQDWVNAVLFCLENAKVSGPVNIVSPEPVTNRTFSAEYASLFKQPWQVPVPSLALKITLGEMSHLALDSQNVRPRQLQENGFQFQFSHLVEALRNLYDINDKNRDVNEFFQARFWVQQPQETVFKYFANDRNLEQIMPSSMQFTVESKSTPVLELNTVMNYSMRMHGLKLTWRSQITSFKPPHEFTDIQLSGPYKKWEHTHRFTPAPNGWTLIEDDIRFQLHMGCLGRILGTHIARREILKIFKHRGEQIKKFLTD